MTEKNGDNLRICLINPQGHVRWKDPPIATHPDTGGQIVYILEVSKELGKLGCRVDIFTRYFNDPEWPGYTKPVEKKGENLRIIRIKCGPEDRFLRKEDLWPVIKEFSEGIVNFYDREGIRPDVMSSHYGDAGLAAAMLKKKIKLPFTHTGHSLGGKKMDNLCMSKTNFNAINDDYNFHLRIAAERVSFRNSHSIIASTKEEVRVQYGHRVYSGSYDGAADKFNIIPPGVEPQKFFPYYKKEKNENLYEDAVRKVKKEIDMYIDHGRIGMPCIFSAARFDAKKNPAGLLHAYSQSKDLQDKMNLVIVAGSVEDPLNPANREKFDEHEREIVEDIAEIIEENGLKGKVCLSHGFDYREMPYVYRYAGRNKWIFVNPALHEPFGLTVVEAMACGVPVVATKYGGPSEILDEGKYGVIVDSKDTGSLKGGLEKLLDEKSWEKYSKKGLKRIRQRFTWKKAAEEYKKLFMEVIGEEIDENGDYDIPRYFLKPVKGNDSELKKQLWSLYFGEQE